MSWEKILTLQSSDGEEFEVRASAASKSTTLKNMIEDDSASGAIPLPNVDGETLAMVIEYCQKRANSEESEASDTKKTYDSEFLDDKGEADLLNLLLAANYLEVEELMEAVCQKIADMIKDWTPEQIRKTFGIVNDFTPEEEEEIRKENAWAFE